jgi:hypothetical protein
MRTLTDQNKSSGKERLMQRVPVTLSNGKEIKSLPRVRDVLVKKVLDDLCPLYVPAGRILYVSDSHDKCAYFDSVDLRTLGVKIKKRGKMPNVVVHHLDEDWLVLIEAVPTHEPVKPKRRQELKELFTGSKIGLVFVTAFMDRKTMMKYLDNISWGTEVWIAESPTHLMHLNGERFLGPYDD